MYYMKVQRAENSFFNSTKAMNCGNSRNQFDVFTRLKLGKFVMEIHDELITAWHTDVPSVHRWIKEVNDGARTGLDDAARPGRLRSSRTDEMKSKVRELIENDLYLSARDVAHKLDIDHSTILRILREDLELRFNAVRLNQISLQMDNARPHTARVVKDFLQKRGITTIWQSPYSPDLNLCDRFLFLWLKNSLREMTFNSPEDVKKASL